MSLAVLAVVSGGRSGRELAGVAVAAGSALLYDVGYVLEKQGLAGQPPVRLHPASVLRTAVASRRWVAGFVAMLGGLALQVLALTLAPVSVVQPILAGGLIALAAGGSMVLGERLTRRDTVALGLVLVAVVAAAVSAHGGGPLPRSVPGGRFLLLAVPAALLAGGAVRAARRRAGSRPEPSRPAPPRPDAPPAPLRPPVSGEGEAALAARRSDHGLVALAVAAGLLYGLGAVAEKAVATGLVSDGLVDGARSALDTAYPWLFVLATFVGMVIFQVGLQTHPASLMASLTNVVSTGCALAGAYLVFGEALLPGGWWSLARLTAFAAVVAALVVLSGARRARDPSRPDPAVAP